MNWQHYHLDAKNKKKTEKEIEKSVSQSESLGESHSYGFLNLMPFLCFPLVCFRLKMFSHTHKSSDKNTYHPTIPTHTPFLSAEVLRLFLSCCTIGLSSFPAFSLCLLALRLRPLGGAAWRRPTLGGSVLPSSLYRRSISLLWNACSSEISFMCLVRRYRERTDRN